MEILVLYENIMNEIRELEILKKECMRGVRIDDREWLESRLLDICGLASALTEHSDQLRKMI